MLVAQITDIHFGFDPDDPAEFNRVRLQKTLQAIDRLDRAPDLMFATGDLADRGDVPAYQRLRTALADLPFPVYPCLGNHDIRANFLRVFPDTETADGFVQYVVEGEGLRFVVLDTLGEGQHGGVFCETRAAWLAARLDDAPDTPTVIVMHHPPIDCGIPWMTTDPREPWVDRLEAVLLGRRQIVGTMCGHVHRPIVAGWAGAPLVVCPATAPQVALTLAPMDPDQPDGRPLIVADPPGFALHYWNEGTLVTHLVNAEVNRVLARFDQGTQEMVETLLGEEAAGVAARA